MQNKPVNAKKTEKKERTGNEKKKKKKTSKNGKKDATVSEDASLKKDVSVKKIKVSRKSIKKETTSKCEPPKEVISVNKAPSKIEPVKIFFGPENRPIEEKDLKVSITVSPKVLNVKSEIVSKKRIYGPMTKNEMEKEEQNEMKKKNDEIAKKTNESLKKLQESNDYLRNKYIIQKTQQSTEEEPVAQTKRTVEEPPDDEKFPNESCVQDRLRANQLLQKKPSVNNLAAKKSSTNITNNSSKKMRRSREEGIKHPTTNEKRLKASKGLKNVSEMRSIKKEVINKPSK